MFVYEISQFFKFIIKMKNTYILLILVIITFLGFKKANLTDTDLVVEPIDWKRFKMVKPSKEFLMSSKLIEKAGKYSYNWANNYYKSSENNEMFLIENINKEQPIRTPACAALGLAVALKTGINPKSIGGEYKEIEKTITKLVKGIVINHKANGGVWGDHWQSTMWIAQIGRAGWLFWDVLDKDTQRMLSKALEYEANRHIKPTYKVDYWNGDGGNSRAEENSWDSMPLQLAIAMMPEHPNVKQWKEICSKLLISAYSIKSDMKKEKPILDGKSPKEWLSGYNVREDGIVINHGILHNDYMVSIAHLQMSGFLVFSLAKQPIPETLDFNFDLIYKTLVSKEFKSPPYKSPGGTMYVKGSPEQYYPEGTDWSQYRYACYYGMDALVDVLGYDKNLPKASEWRQLRAERILELQSRHKDGRMYKDGEYDNYWGKEQMVFWMMADAHLLQWIKDRGELSKKRNWLD